jgi:multiple sugar transport system permease protein
VAEHRAVDTWPGLIIPYMTFTLPLAIYTLSAFFREIPWELEQAAQVDGATPFQAFRKVIVPLAAPGMFTTAILVFISRGTTSSSRSRSRRPSRRRTVPAAISSFPGASQFTQPTGSIRRGLDARHHPIIILSS